MPRRPVTRHQTVPAKILARLQEGSRNAAIEYRLFETKVIRVDQRRVEDLRD